MRQTKKTKPTKLKKKPMRSLDPDAPTFDFVVLEKKQPKRGRK